MLPRPGTNGALLGAGAPLHLQWIEDIVGFPRQDDIATGERKNTVPESSKVAIFDGHNDVVQHLAEYREGGRDFLVRSEDGHLDLPRAQEGGMIGGLFALFAKPERPPEGNVTRTADGYEVRLADPLDAVYARSRINSQLSALKHVVVRAGG